MESFTKTCRDYDMRAGAKLLSRQIVPVRQEEQEFFGLGPDGLLVYVERLRTADSMPILRASADLSGMSFTRACPSMN